MRIGCDIDGVLADFNQSFIRAIIRHTGRNLFADPPVLDCWDYPQKHGYTDAELDIVWTDYITTNFWWELTPYKDTLSSLRALRQSRHEVYFVTARPTSAGLSVTRSWLQDVVGWDNWPMNFSTLLSTQKGLCARALALDAFLDDNYDNCVDVYWTSPTTQVFLFDRPWNRQYGPGNGSDFVRVGSVQEMLAILSAKSVP